MGAHFTVQRADLVRELALVAGVVERRTMIPILSNVRLDVGVDGLRMTGTDLEIGMICNCAADVKEAGVATLPAKRLLDYVRLLPEGPVEIKIAANNWAHISAGRSKTKIAGMDGASFPELPVARSSDVQQLPGAEFAKMIVRVEFAISAEESRFTLRGALLETSETAMRLVATDGHRLALSEALFQGRDSKGVFPRRAMAELKKLVEVEGKDAMIALSSDDNHYFAAVGQRCLVARKLTGNFPDYARVMPKDQKYSATVAVSDLKEAIGRAGLMADERCCLIRVKFSPEGISVSSSVSEKGEAHEGVPAEYEGPEIEIGMNAAYVADFLAAVKTEKALLRIKDANSAVELSPLGEDGYRCVVMPMRI